MNHTNSSPPLPPPTPCRSALSVSSSTHSTSSRRGSGRSISAQQKQLLGWWPLAVPPRCLYRLHVRLP